jgi:hypothetical protein
MFSLSIHTDSIKTHLSGLVWSGQEHQEDEEVEIEEEETEEEEKK